MISRLQNQGLKGESKNLINDTQERELAADETTPAPNVVFDDSGNFVLYPTLLGIKVVNLVTNRLVRLIGKVENTERFLRIALYQVGTTAPAAAEILCTYCMRA